MFTNQVWAHKVMIAHPEFVIVQAERLAIVFLDFVLGNPTLAPLRFPFLLSK